MEKQGGTLYLECNSGISGDMTVGALLDLGADREVLEKALRSIPIHGFWVKVSRVKKAGLDVCDFAVILDEEYENHDHDMEYLFGKKHSAGDHSGDEPGKYHDAEKDHCHGDGGQNCYGGEEEHHHHAHEHRNLAEILHIIEHTDMAEGAKMTAKRIFEILAAAEAKAHGLPEEAVHFHEVGAVDSIVDIISVAVCLDDLGVMDCIVPALCEGSGTIRCQHGILSVPVPAVLNIAQAHQLKLSITDMKGELVTPTGAAIVAAVKTADKLPKQFRVIRTGMGGGKREYERPSILRAMLIEETGDFEEVEGIFEGGREETEKAEGILEGGREETEKAEGILEGGREETEKAEGILEGGKEGTDTVNRDDDRVETIKNKGNRADKDVIYKLETNIDDCSGEVLGYVLDRLLQAGARDAHYLPVYMKKNRPAYQLNVICREEQIPVLENIIFTETTTIGIRRIKMERSVLPRRKLEVLTELGNAVVKECTLPGDGGVRYYPEYDSVVDLCKTSGKSFREVYGLIEEHCKK